MQIQLTDELRAICSEAMAHPSEWAVEDALGFGLVKFADEVPCFVVKSVSDYDGEYVLVEGYWPNVPVTLTLAGKVTTATMNIPWGGNVSLDYHSKLAALLAA